MISNNIHCHESGMKKATHTNKSKVIGVVRNRLDKVASEEQQDHSDIETNSFVVDAR